jgi:hypothetical protein
VGWLQTSVASAMSGVSPPVHEKPIDPGAQTAFESSAHVVATLNVMQQ